MKFFSGQRCSDYFNNRYGKIKDEIDLMNDKEITTCDFNEWEEYLYSKYSLNTITLFEENISQSLSERKIKKYNHYYGTFPGQKEYFEVDGYCITFRIYFDGDVDLFQLQPSTQIMDRFEPVYFSQPRNKECGYFTLELVYTKQEIEGKSDLQVYVKREFENMFKGYRTMIQYVNTETKTYNSSLTRIIKDLLTKRKEKASSFALLSKQLEIPMKLSSNAPNMKPIPLTKINRTPPQKPQRNPLPTEYYISKQDYSNINNIIAMCGTTMEKTARTYYRNDEEELRDHLLAALNTHYDNATGETFRKIGKTDIHIEFENKAAFIGECKIWHGGKLFTEAIQQLLNYSTWKDTKVSLVIFNKENKSFQGILTSIESWIKENTKSSVRQQHNIWNCKFYRTDMQIEIDLNISVFDLYVDKTQFKDSIHY